MPTLIGEGQGLQCFFEVQDLDGLGIGLQVLHGIRYPELLEPSAEQTATSYVLPEAALAELAA